MLHAVHKVRERRNLASLSQNSETINMFFMVFQRFDEKHLKIKNKLKYAKIYSTFFNGLPWGILTKNVRKKQDFTVNYSKTSGLTISGGFSPFKAATKFVAAFIAMASLVSIVALPM